MPNEKEYIWDTSRRNTAPTPATTPQQTLDTNNPLPANTQCGIVYAFYTSNAYKNVTVNFFG